MEKYDKFVTFRKGMNRKIQARTAGATHQELLETFSIGLVVGGSIVIPHLRKAVDFLEELDRKI